MPRLLFIVKQLLSQLWVHAALYSLAGLAAALAGAFFAHLVPEELAVIGGDAVDEILSVLASSMLAVTIFSLTTLVTAYTSVSQTTTPRAARLVVSGGGGQGALSTFVGSFLFAVVAIVALNTEVYGSGGRAIVFAVTMVVLLLVILALLRWIDELQRIGRVDEAVRRVSEAARDALHARLAARPGAARERPICPPVARVLTADRVGYLQNVDVPALRRALEDAPGVSVWLEALPGAFLTRDRPIARIHPAAGADETLVKRVRKALVLGEQRTFEQDPRFGLVTLGEIAAKALSPGVNDPGTAVDVLGHALRLLQEWALGEDENDEQTHPPERLYFPALEPYDLMEDVFGPVTRFGAADPTVGLRLQRVLRALAETDCPETAAAARRLSLQALRLAEHALPLEEHKARVRAAAPLAT